MIVRIFVTAGVWLLSTIALAEGVKAKPIKVPAAAPDGIATEIPVTVVQGAKPGKSIAVICGLTGTEYAPILAMQALSNQFKTEDMRGTLTIVEIANRPAFEARAIAKSPGDGKDLTRVFPGSATGTITERIAWALTKEVIEKADAVILLRAGSLIEVLTPYLMQPVTGDSSLDLRIRDMAIAFGSSMIVIDSKVARAGTLESFVLASGKPVITVYGGAGGMTEGRITDMFQRGVHGVLAVFEMEPGKVPTSRGVTIVEERMPLESPSAGLLALYVYRGQRVTKGEPLFGVADIYGKNPKLVNSPMDGIVLHVASSMPLDKGQTVVVIGKPRE